MVTLGIFGDSFAAEWDLLSYGADQSWPMQIKNLYQTQNFAKSGTSLEYSIDLFEKNHKNFDKVIFVTTDHPRIYYPKELKRRGMDITDMCYFWITPDQCDQCANLYENVDDFFNKMRDVIEILLHDNNRRYLSIQYSSLIKYVQNVRPDVTLIPGCGINLNLDLWLNIGYSWDMGMIYAWETHNLHYNYDDLWQSDNRPNHLSIENNQWMLKHIISRLNGEFIDWEPLNSFYFKTNKDFEKYFIDKKRFF